MKHLRKLTKVAPFLLAGCVGGATAVWSPISCSCLSAWEDIATGLGHFDVNNPDQLTAEFIANAIRDKFSGKPIQAKDLPFATTTTDCIDGNTPDKAIRCTWWLWESDTRKKGYDVLVATDSRGAFQRVVVTPVTTDGA